MDARVLVLSIDRHTAEDGIAAWHGPTLWHRAKQEVHPAMTPFSGDLVGRVLAARQERSAKCLVLDLDNTLWGCVISDDGLEGIVPRQGGALGETYVAFQTYAKALSRRGVMAVCAKNDVANALAAFDQHCEMVLKRGDTAPFVANWSATSHQAVRPSAPDRSGMSKERTKFERPPPYLLARGVLRSPRSRCGRPALLATTCSAIVLSLLAGGAEQTTRTLASAAVATKLTAQMGNIHSPHMDIVAVSTKESNYAI